jgi:hypothetical protein
MDVKVFGRQAPSEIVLRARSVAGQYLEKLFRRFNEGITEQFNQFHWIKPELTSPSFEHFTFGYKNAVFAVLVDLIDDGVSKLPMEKKSLLCSEALKYNLVPCLFEVAVQQVEPDQNGLFNGVSGKSCYNLRVVSSGWNLKHARTGDRVDPFDFGKDFDTPMSEWELQNFAIGIARNYGVVKGGFDFDSFCDIPGIDPQMWFHDKSGKRSWAIVRFQRVLNEGEADLFRDFVRDNPHLKPYDGYFVPVSAAMADAVVRDRNENVVPLSRRFDGSAPIYRGCGMYVNFQRMIKIYEAE